MTSSVLFLFLLLLVFAGLIASNHHIKTLEEELLRESFHQTFAHHCKKYNFIEKYWRNLAHPYDRFIEFVYHEQGLKNGGFGDRLGGLITAAAIALRTNRTLLIKATNGFGDYFRPHYNPGIAHLGPLSDVEKKELFDRYTYNNYTLWARYNVSLSNNDATELDLWNCININGKLNDICGLDHITDANEPIIKLRSNRCYLCKWVLHEGTVANVQLKEALGVDQTSNLFEVAGCLLRLVMWPTDLLFEKLAEVFRSELKAMDTIPPQTQVQNVDTAGVSTAKTWALSNSAIKRLPLLIGLHFRCGDRSYQRGAAYDHVCEHDPAVNTSDVHNLHGETDYMVFGTPIDIGKCAAGLLANLTNPNSSPSHHGNRRLQESGSPPVTAIVHIASDNHGSAMQMHKVTGWPRTFVSPTGCHVEWDPSQSCTEKTIVYWLLLSMSDFIVSQSEFGCPISGFSRFASIYGLKGDNWMDARDCSLPSFAGMGLKRNGNWFCN